MEQCTAVQKREDRAELDQDNKFMSRSVFRPRVDVFETDDEILLELDLPGVKPADVNLRFEKGELTVLGRVEPRGEVESYVLCEYGVGDFSRAFTIHQEVEGSKITAELQAGVLTVHLPKAEKAKPRRITVKGE